VRRSILVFTDGAASGNPGPGGWAAIILDLKNQIIELGGGERHTTNNRMEMLATVEALRKLSGTKVPIEIRTDSKYVIDGVTKWVHGWKKRDWKTAAGEPVVHPDLWQALDELNQSHQITWTYVPGHSGVPGNERADEIAVAFSQGKTLELYTGPASKYDIDLEAAADPAWKTSVYLSYIDGKIYRDATWAECEKRVKGKRGVKYKKVSSAREEKETLKGWGVSADEAR
jgi:ribonuclease HI